METVFDTTIDTVDATLSAKPNAEQFLNTINRPKGNYEIKNSTIFSKSNNYIDRTLKVFYQRELLIGSVDNTNAVAFDEYSKSGFYWGGDVQIEYAALKGGVKLKDLRLSPGDDHTIQITSLGDFSGSSKEMSKLLDEFIGDTHGSPKNNLVLWLVQNGQRLSTQGIDYLGDKKLGVFNSVIYYASSVQAERADLNDIVNCAADNLMIAFNYDKTFPQDVKDLCKKYNLRLTCNDIYNIVNGKKYPKIEEKLVPFLTNIAKNNPKTNIYFSDYNENGTVFVDVLKISYTAGELSIKYLRSVEL